MILLRLCVIAASLLGLGATSLYSDSPYVMEVTGYPPMGQCPWYVVFYVSWCGHCQAFAPGYKKFAQSLENDTYGTVVAAIDCVRYETHCQSINVTEYPTLMYYDGDRPTKLNALHHDFATGMPLPAIAKDNAAHKECIFQKHRRLKESHVSSPNATAPMVWFNAYLSFQQSLTHEVPDKVRADALIPALNTSVNVLGQFAVPKEVRVYREFLSQAYLAIPQLRSPKGPVGEKGCSFTCGLWRLYHGMVEGPRPVEALHAIADYVVTFFQCVECRGHFAEMAAAIDKTVWDAASARLWLWKAHNKVNLRLKKPFFPSRAQCVACATDDDVLVYLHKRYAAVSRPAVKQHGVLVSSVEDATEAPVPMDPISAGIMILLLFFVAVGVGCMCTRRLHPRRALALIGLSKNHIS